MSSPNCPAVFNFEDSKSYTFLTRAQFCDDELTVDGEKFTYEEMKRYSEHSSYKRDCFLRLITPVIVDGGKEAVAELSALFSNFQGTQFECSYPLILEALSYYSQVAKEAVAGINVAEKVNPLSLIGDKS